MTLLPIAAMIVSGVVGFLIGLLGVTIWALLVVSNDPDLRR